MKINVDKIKVMKAKYDNKEVQIKIEMQEIENIH